MPVPKLIDVDIVRGQAANFLVTVPAEANLAAATIDFGISIGPSQPYIIDLSTTIDGQIITASLTGEQSETLDKVKYYYSCWVIISGDPTPVARGYINVTKDSRNN